MTLTRWYRPSACGDFQLERIEDTVCKLVVKDPTPYEREQLELLMKNARENGYIDMLEGFGSEGGELVLNTSIEWAGNLLFGTWGAPHGSCGQVQPPRALLSVAMCGDKVVATWDSTQPKRCDEPTDLVPVEADKAITTPAPRRGSGGGDCPESLASEVLRAFSTPDQWAEWQRTGGTMTVRGGCTGRRYRLAHRKCFVQTRRQETVAVGLDDRLRGFRSSRAMPVLAFDFELPPPEEVLSIKLVLEQREWWLRNPGSMPGARDEVFEDPFPGEVARTNAQMDRIGSFETSIEPMVRGAAIGMTLMPVMDELRRQRRAR